MNGELENWNDYPARATQRRRHPRAWLGDPLTVVILLASLIDQAERMLPEHVLEALDNDATWHDIAVALATSPEQAELRYSPGSPVADTQVALRLLNQPKPSNVTSRPARE